MALTIAQLIGLSGRQIIIDEGRNYTLSDVHYLEGADAYVVFLSDKHSGCRVTITWTQGNEDRNDVEARIELAGHLLENAINSLTFLIEEQAGKYGY